MKADESFTREMAGVVVDALNLETAAAQLDVDASLFGDGLGLDSIDILELALVVSKKYGLELRADDENNQEIFASVRSLADHVAAHRAGASKAA
jgi:acyl carrier protein